jgi:hypothetical protein
MSKFREIIRDFLTPDSAEVSLGFLKAKYSDSARADIRKVLSALRGRRVLLAQMEHEIWEYVFKSMHELRDMFVKLSGDLSAESSNEVRNTVDYLT